MVNSKNVKFYLSVDSFTAKLPLVSNITTPCMDTICCKIPTITSKTTTHCPICVTSRKVF